MSLERLLSYFEDLKNERRQRKRCEIAFPCFFVGIHKILLHLSLTISMSNSEEEVNKLYDISLKLDSATDLSKVCNNVV